jgi:hypothetical protein
MIYRGNNNGKIVDLSNGNLTALSGACGSLSAQRIYQGPSDTWII